MDSYNDQSYSTMVCTDLFVTSFLTIFFEPIGNNNFVLLYRQEYNILIDNILLKLTIDSK